MKVQGGMERWLQDHKGMEHEHEHEVKFMVIKHLKMDNEQK